jgi:hypothetical protein
MQSPQKVARTLLACVLGSTIFADYWTYSKDFNVNPEIWMDVVRGTADAPQQYRVGVVRTAELLARLGHIGMRHAFTLIDLCCASLAVYLLFALLERSQVYKAASDAVRWFGAIGFVFLLQYYFFWTTWYQKPETMASVLAVAATLGLLTIRLPLAPMAETWVLSGGMIVLAVVQSLIRADVVVALHLGVLVVCRTTAGNRFALPRKTQQVTSAAAVLIAVAILIYLIRVAYPHATYGKSPVFELVLNFTDTLRLVPFALFMLPWGWTATMVVRRKMSLDAPYLALLIGSAIYLLQWWLMGKVDEVRIFLPFALALAPLTVTCAMEEFAGAPRASSGRHLTLIESVNRLSQERLRL